MAKATQATVAHRQFYEFQLTPQTGKAEAAHEDKNQEKNEIERKNLFHFISSNIIGSDSMFKSPFGERRVTYCDYTASGRSLKFLEDYIVEQVLPHYGSTHTTTSVTALQTSLFRHEARDIIRNAVRASEHDRIIFTGSGATGAINRLIHGLNFLTPPIVFVDFAAHHSSLLPWREIGATVMRVREDIDGNLNLKHLELLLRENRDAKRQLIGCFTAASNITGVILDENSITNLLHRYGALAFWDFATAAPYTDVLMNPRSDAPDSLLSRKDAIFFSLHKFIGGVQTPGVLVARKELFENKVPFEPGGGTVFFVSRESHRYLKDVEEREEGGTPPIVETIRGGMVMQLKMSLSPDAIMERCRHLSKLMKDFISSTPELVPLGNTSANNRLPILSFLVRHEPSGKFLHYNYVSALLNDLFGIQSRGGCACAGPYAQDLLGIDEPLAHRYEKLLIEDPTLDRAHLRRKEEHSNLEILRPGFVRINLPYTAPVEQINFIFSALKIVCKDGWKLLPQYIFNPETGEWKHHSNLVFKNRQWLQNISYSKGFFEANLKPQPVAALSYEEMLLESQDILREAGKVSNRTKIADQSILFKGEAAELCWFLHPSEAQNFLKGPAMNDVQNMNAFKPPFTPQVYPLSSEVIRCRPDFIWQSENMNIKSNFSTSELCRNIESNFSTSELSSNIKSNISTSNFCSNIKSNFSTSDLCSNIKSNFSTSDLCSNIESNFSISDPCSNNKSNFSTSDLCSNIESNFSTSELCSNKLSADVIDSSKKNACDFIPCDKDLVVRSDDIEQICNKIVANDIADKSNEASDSKSNQDKMVNNCENGVCCVRTQENCVSAKTTPIVSKSLWVAPPKSIFNQTLEAVQSFKMIRPQDKVLVCLSGGKDSLSLLHTLRQYQFYARSKGTPFTLGAVTVDPQSSSYDPSPLIPYLKSLGVPYFYEKQGILQQAMGLEELNSICSFCSRMKRGRIYSTARREGFNVLAMGQHLDDLAESFLMSVFHNGRLRTMKASYTVKEGDLRVIRPFVYVREVELRNFAETNKLPIIPENCPGCFESPKERHRVKQLLANQEVLFPKLFWSLKTALHPILAIGRTGVENNIFGKKSTNSFSYCGEDDEE